MYILPHNTIDTTINCRVMADFKTSIAQTVSRYVGSDVRRSFIAECLGGVNLCRVSVIANPYYPGLDFQIRCMESHIYIFMAGNSGNHHVMETSMMIEPLPFSYAIDNEISGSREPIPCTWVRNYTDMSTMQRRNIGIYDSRYIYHFQSDSHHLVGATEHRWKWRFRITHTDIPKDLIISGKIL